MGWKGLAWAEVKTEPSTRPSGPGRALSRTCCVILDSSWSPLPSSVPIELEIVGLATLKPGKWAIGWDVGGVYCHGFTH